jgi:hypothetical protein
VTFPHHHPVLWHLPMPCHPPGNIPYRFLPPAPQCSPLLMSRCVGGSASHPNLQALSAHLECPANTYTFTHNNFHAVDADRIAESVVLYFRSLTRLPVARYGGSEQNPKITQFDIVDKCCHVRKCRVGTHVRAYHTFTYHDALVPTSPTICSRHRHVI